MAASLNITLTTMRPMAAYCYMTLSGKCLCCLLLLGNVYTAKAQDLYDHKHCLLYARHLLDKKQYLQAGDEYRRAALLKKDDLDSRYNMLKAYAQSENHTLGILHSKPLMDSLQPAWLNLEYLHLLMRGYFLKDATSLIMRPRSLDSLQALKARLDLQLLDGRWQEAAAQYPKVKFADSMQAHNYLLAIQAVDHIKHKSPALAAGLSAIVPGSGKIYTGDWQDGLQNMVIIGTAAYAACYGFSKRGERSVLGYIFGGVAIGFYGGNIYGSYLGAKRYNIRQQNDMRNYAAHTVYSTF